MIYEYTCAGGHYQAISRSISERNDPLNCGCGQPAMRIFSRPQLITDRMCDRPQNKYVFGTSECERKETLRSHERAYEAKNANQESFTKVTKPKETLMETYSRMWGGI